MSNMQRISSDSDFDNPSTVQLRRDPAMSPLIRMLPSREESQIDLCSRPNFPNKLWKSEIFSFSSLKPGPRWKRNAAVPVRHAHEPDEDSNETEARAILNLSKWKNERLHARLTLTLGCFVLPEADHNRSFVAAHAGRLAKSPEFAGRAAALRASLQILDGLIDGAVARSERAASRCWPGSAAEEGGRPSTARIRRD